MEPRKKKKCERLLLFVVPVKGPLSNECYAIAGDFMVTLLVEATG